MNSDTQNSRANPSTRSLQIYLFLGYDWLYQQLNRPIAVDDFLRIKPTRYHGPARTLNDGTRLRSGDAIAELHFNNQYLAKCHGNTQPNSQYRTAFLFKTAIVRSLYNLVKLLRDDRRLRQTVVFTGITWFKPHGGRLGFDARPLPPGVRKRFLTWHFRWLLAARFPHLAARENRRLQPHRFWLTREQLLQVTEHATR